MIRGNAHKYSVSAMCKCLGIARSTIYYKPVAGNKDGDAEIAIKKAYVENRSVYGARKIKKLLEREGANLSRRRIVKIMSRLGLKPAYTSEQPKAPRSKPAEIDVSNELNRVFDGHSEYAAVVSDLTYVRVNYKWNYVCILLDLYNREVIGYSAGPRKDAQLVLDAFATVPLALDKIQLFHTDRGGEFNNFLVDEILKAFEIRKSLSLKACPYDNSVAESTFKSIKAEFVYRHHFTSLSELRLQLADYVNWFNTKRLHSTLGYLSPAEYKAST